MLCSSHSTLWAKHSVQDHVGYRHLGGRIAKRSMCGFIEMFRFLSFGVLCDPCSNRDCVYLSTVWSVSFGPFPLPAEICAAVFMCHS